MNHVIVIAAIALLVLLFLKVPVYISVLAASVIYFIGSPNVNSTVFAQQVRQDHRGCPFWQFRSLLWPVYL